MKTTILLLLISFTINAQEYIEPYTVYFDYELKIPSKVTYTVKKPLYKVKRNGHFQQYEGTIHPNQYKGSGYDRGHLFPCNQAKDIIQMHNSFNMKNILPQHPSLNRGVWAQLEKHVDDLAVNNDSVCVEIGYIGIEKFIDDLPIPLFLYKKITIWSSGKNRKEKHFFRNSKKFKIE